jgi:hypothetical protein
MQQNSSGWDKVIGAVTAPLGFYSLLILSVFAFVTAGCIWGQSPATAALMWAALALATAVFGYVAVMTWRDPRDLTFTQGAHLLALKSKTLSKSMPGQSDESEVADAKAGLAYEGAEDNRNA